MMSKSFVIMSSNVQRCPKHSWSAEHYHPDGSCKCNEVEDKKARLMVLEEKRRQFNNTVGAEIEELRDDLKFRC